MSIADEIKHSFKTGTMLARLIYINLAVFILVNVALMIFYLFNVPGKEVQLIHWLAVPADFSNLITRPWTLITYMFLHEGFLHILFNLLWLYWFGKIFLLYLNEKQLLSTYILGGLAGAALYIIAFNVFPAFQQVLSVSYALGASAAVLAIVVAISVYVPNYEIYLMFLGPVKLKYIALVTIGLDIISIAGTNAGGHIAHLGGAAFGYLYISRYKQGKDIAKGFNKTIDSFVTLFKPRKKLKVTYKNNFEHKTPPSDIDYNKQKHDLQMEMDRILDKIAKSGYESLSKKEKDFLFRMDNKR